MPFWKKVSIYQFFISTTCIQYRVKGYKQTKNGSNTYTNNNYHTQTNTKAVSQYNKCNQVPLVPSSKDHLIKEPKYFTCCEEVGYRKRKGLVFECVYTELVN